MWVESLQKTRDKKMSIIRWLEKSAPKHLRSEVSSDESEADDELQLESETEINSEQPQVASSTSAGSTSSGTTSSKRYVTCKSSIIINNQNIKKLMRVVFTCPWKIHVMYSVCLGHFRHLDTKPLMDSCL